MNDMHPIPDTITLSHGSLQGIHLPETGAVAWLGVPYARPPVGELRWKAPREAESWTGVRLAQDYGPCSLQHGPDGVIGSEDCLYLNVWRPDQEETDLPVFVYLHGGGNISGSGRDCPGGELARDTRSIVVTVNYRLGALGFFRHPALYSGDPQDDSGNYGLLDAIQALRWVQTHITRFGGNPGNVTLAGQSAGARNALAAYLSPLGRGLFHQLFILSGGMTTASCELGETKAREIAAELARRIGKALDAVDTVDATKAQAWLAAQSDQAIADWLYRQEGTAFAEAIKDTGLRMSAFPHLFEDGVVIPAGGFAALSSDTHRPLPAVLGSNATEFSGFALSHSLFASLAQEGISSGNAPLQQLYEAAIQHGSELYAAFNVEEVASQLLHANANMPVYGYRFGWGLQDDVIDTTARLLLGAPHGADLPFYTGDFSGMEHNYPGVAVTSDNEPGRLALLSLMRGYLRQFLHTKNPNGASLPAWSRLQTNPGSATVQWLDATANAALVYPISGLCRQDILANLEADERLTPEQRSWLRTELFAGRFFWQDR